MVRDAVGIWICPQFLRGLIVQIILYNTLILTSEFFPTVSFLNQTL